MQVVYVLVSGPDDFYAEQAFGSMYSLKLHNPSAKITLLTDGETLRGLKVDRERLLQLVDHVKTIDVPAHFSPKQKTSFIKTSVRSHVDGPMLFLDCDTVVAANLEGIKDFSGNILAAADCHAPASENLQLKECRTATGIDIDLGEIYFNSGFLWIEDNAETRKFFEDWHRFWLEFNKNYKITVDQFAFALATRENPGTVRELPGQFNCQIVFRPAVKYITKAKVVHYTGASKTYDAFPMKTPELLREIRESGLTERARFVLENPVEALLENSIIVGGRDLEIHDSPMCILARKLSREFAWSNRMARLIYRLFGFKI